MNKIQKIMSSNSRNINYNIWYYHLPPFVEISLKNIDDDVSFRTTVFDRTFSTDPSCLPLLVSMLLCQQKETTQNNNNLIPRIKPRPRPESPEYSC